MWSRREARILHDGGANRSWRCWILWSSPSWHAVSRLLDDDRFVPLARWASRVLLGKKLKQYPIANTVVVGVPFNSSSDAAGKRSSFLRTARIAFWWQMERQRRCVDCPHDRSNVTSKPFPPSRQTCTAQPDPRPFLWILSLGPCKESIPAAGRDRRT